MFRVSAMKYECPFLRNASQFLELYEPGQDVTPDVLSDFSGMGIREGRNPRTVRCVNCLNSLTMHAETGEGGFPTLGVISQLALTSAECLRPKPGPVVEA